MSRPARILPLIIFSQFAGTSLWFAGNAILGDMGPDWGIQAESAGPITAMAQFGFIVGTLLFALLHIADRIRAPLVFLICSWAGALSNVSILFLPPSFEVLLASRFLTGFFLAGVYPVGMKIAAGWYKEGLGRALGYLVGALVLGTAFPHMMRGLGANLNWQAISLGVSLVAALGGLLTFLLVPEGQAKITAAPAPGPIGPASLFRIFKSPDFRAAAFGYSGHMWELYAFWAFVPLLLTELSRRDGLDWNVSLRAFLVIGIGAAGCILGGLYSLRKGSARTAFQNLLVSGLACALSPLLFFIPAELAFVFLLVWGFAVVGDSPQFSALSAQTAPPELLGTALTIVTSIGFAVTILSIQLLYVFVSEWSIQYAFLLLAPGPVLGLLAVSRLVRRDSKTNAEGA